MQRHLPEVMLPAYRQQQCAKVMNGSSLVRRSAYFASFAVSTLTRVFRWITNGTFADYFTVGCRTEVPLSSLIVDVMLISAKTGFTVILVPRSDNVSTKAIKTAYSSTAGTAYVTFDKVRVPVSYTLGKVGKGMQVILSNFNHERWMIVCTSLSAQRRIVEECLKWSNQRVVFGKPLNAQAVIRSKLANMIARVEAGQNWLEFVTHQMNNVRNISSSHDRHAND